jgi:hypothetical protein
VSFFEACSSHSLLSEAERDYLQAKRLYRAIVGT